MSGPERAWSVIRSLEWTAEAFRERGLDSPRRQAELLLSEATGLSRIQLYTQHDRPLSPEEREAFRVLVKRRSQREPLQYITGHQEFWSLDFRVGPGVLVPRADTEVLVEATLAWAVEQPADSELRIVDVGTGSGAVALALASELTTAKILAVDISVEALGFARDNAKHNGLDGRVAFRESRLLEGLVAAHRKVDAVVSNPPYITTEEMRDLMPEVSEHEPHLALHGGADGLDIIRPLVAQSAQIVEPGGLLAIEIGSRPQAEATATLLAEAGFENPQIRNDYGDRARVVHGRRPVG